MLKIKFKKLHEDAVLPVRAKDGDAGMDIVTVNGGVLSPDMEQITYDLGLAMEIPVGYVGLLFPRSSSVKTQLTLANCVGVIDSGYRGPVSAVFDRSRNVERPDYNKGDRVVQLVVLAIPELQTEWADELSTSERGSGGWGSSGR